ncbi:MAG TPA: hypothetical protein VN026_17875 [Bacteroidia bacterium]|jgi:hypothetical protein|nr:hypothetical protein [Bacteroidia bacterium]
MKPIYVTIFVLGTLFTKAQTSLYNKLSSFLNTHTKEVLIDQRLIAINVWTSGNKNSRDLNADFEKAYKVYEFAKLKGGNKGIIVLNIDLDNNSVNGDITLKKDGISKIITIPSDNIEILNELKGKTSGYNIVFDSNGNMVYENLAAGTVYESIHKLITR